MSRVPKGTGSTFGEVLERRLSRRDVLKVGLVTSAAVTLWPALGAGSTRPGVASPASSAASQGSTLTFGAIQPDTSDEVRVAEGYRAQVIASWGDPLFPGVPPFDINAQTAALQERRFGFNSDFVAYLPLPIGSGNPGEGLLWNNHEYPIHAVPVEGPERGHLKQFLSAVKGSEVASLVFNTDDGALFASIQHPGEGGKLSIRW